MEQFDVRRALKMRVVRKSLANEGVGGGRGRKTDRTLSTVSCVSVHYKMQLSVLSSKQLVFSKACACR